MNLGDVPPTSMQQFIDFILNIFVHTDLPKAFKNPWLLTVIILMVILTLVVLFVDKDFRFWLYGMGRFLSVLFKASP